MINIYTMGTYNQRSTEPYIADLNPTKENYVDSLNITIASYGFLLVLFPVRNSMKSTVRS